MLSFTQYLFEMAIPNLKDSMGKMRHTMPQFSDFEAFLKDLSENNIMVSNTERIPSDLTPTQKNFNESKVETLKAKASWTSTEPPVLNGLPIVVSQDDYVIDGHHRWLCAHALGTAIKCHVIGMKAEDLLEFLKNKPYVFHKTINEQTFAIGV